MRGEILDFLELDVGLRFAAGGHVGGLRAVDLEARGPCLQGVTSGLESRGWKSEAPSRVRDHADADGRAVLPGADDDALHRPFFGGADLASQRHGHLGVRDRREKSETNDGDGAADHGNHLSLLSPIRDLAAIGRLIPAVSNGVADATYGRYPMFTR